MTGLRGPDDRTLLDAVGRIYAAALDSAEWQGAIATVGRLVGANSGLLQVTGLPGTQVGYVGFGVDPERARTYVEHFAAVDLYLPAARARAKPGDVVWEYEMVPPDRLPGTEIFEDYLRPQGLFGFAQSLGGILQNDARGLAFVQFVDRTRRRSLAPSAAATLHLLLSHLRRAVDIQTRIGEARLAEATLDRLQMGVVLVDSHGRVLRLNKAATDTLSTRDGLELRRDGLHAGGRKERSALQRMIAQTATSGADGRMPGGTLAIQRPSGRRPLSVVAMPGPSADALFSPMFGTAVILFISDPEAGPPPAPVETLSALYGLTPAEARTALLVAEGRAPKDVAETLGVSVHTVRTVLKRVFAKTGVARQAALARLVTLALPFLRPES